MKERNMVDYLPVSGIHSGAQSDRGETTGPDGSW